MMPFEVAIAGAGIIGSSIAWRLAQAGVSVALLDAATLGAEASWAGAGMLAPGGEFQEPSPWLDFALESLRLYPDFCRELSEETGLTIDYRACGAVELADDWPEMEQRAKAQRLLGIPSREMAWRGARAMWFPEDAIVDPRDITRALRAACTSRGVVIRENEAVREVRPGVEVVTAGETLRVRAAVIAAGAWSSGIRGFAIPESFPVRGHLLGYHLPPGSLGPILRRGHTYILQRSSGFTIAGTSSEQAGFDRAIDAAIVADIHRRASGLFPELPEPAEAWLGFRPAAAAFEPQIRRIEEAPLWLAYGHYRNGILLTPATAKRVAAEIIVSLRKG